MADAQGSATKVCAEFSACTVQVRLRCSKLLSVCRGAGWQLSDTVIGTLRQGEWDRSLVTLKHLMSAQRVRPCLTRCSGCELHGSSWKGWWGLCKILCLSRRHHAVQLRLMAQQAACFIATISDGAAPGVVANCIGSLPAWYVLPHKAANYIWCPQHHPLAASRPLAALP